MVKYDMCDMNRKKTQEKESKQSAIDADNI